MEDDTEDDAENGHLFLTPKQGNTPSLEDVLQAKPPSLPAFTAPVSTNPGPDFPPPKSSQQKELILPWGLAYSKNGLVIRDRSTGWRNPRNALYTISYCRKTKSRNL